MRPRFYMIAACGFVVVLAANVRGQQPLQPVVGDSRSLPVPAPAAVLSPIDTSVRTAEGMTSTGTPVVSASATVPSSRSLQNTLLRAKGSLVATELPNVARARAELGQALSNLERFVVIDSPNGVAWSAFLRLDELRVELAKDVPQLNTLVDLEMNMRQNYVGLEYPQFTQVRDKLNQTIRALRYGSNPDASIELLGKKIDELITELNKPLAGSDLARSNQVGIVANYLHESQQVPWAVSEIRSQFSIPNIQVTLQESLLNRMLSRSVAEPNPVRECILGTSILGQACLLGTVSADVVPMNNGVSLRLNMSATLTSQNKGYNRGVVLNTTGYSPVYASKQIFVTPTGISSAPATVSTNLQSTINSIEHRLRLVRRIAEKKAAEQKPQADAIAEGRMQTKIQSQYDQQVTTQLNEASAQLSTLQQTQRPEVKRIGITRPTLAVYSTDTAVHGSLLQAASHQLAAGSSCMLPIPMSSAVLVRAHQSAMINALDVVLGGRTIRSQNLDEYAQQILGEVPPEVSKEANGEEWSITMALFHPVELEFIDGRVKIILKISQMTRGDQVLADPAIITATYLPNFYDGVLTLKREGPVTIDFTRESRGVRVVTLRSFLKGKFETTFKEEFVTKRIDLNGRFPRAPHLTVDHLNLGDGWLQVGLR